MDADGNMHGKDKVLDPRVVKYFIARRQDPFPQTTLLGQTNSLGVVTGQPPTLMSSLVDPFPQSSKAPPVLSSALGAASSRLIGLSSMTGTASFSTNSPANPSMPISSVVSSVASPTSSVKSSDTSIGSTSSGPSAGLIAGAVIGSVAVLVLIGIFVLLYLRHKRTANKDPSTDTPAQVGGPEKEPYNDNTTTIKPELATNANAWELQGSGAQGHRNAHSGQGPWELPGHVAGQTASNLR